MHNKHGNEIFSVRKYLKEMHKQKKPYRSAEAKVNAVACRRPNKSNTHACVHSMLLQKKHSYTPLQNFTLK